MLMPSGSMNRNGYMAELSLNLPWLNRSKHDSEIQEAQAQVNVERKEQEEDAQLQAVLAEVQKQYVIVKTSEEQLLIYRDGLIPQAQAAIQAGLAAYQSTASPIRGG